MMDKRTNDTGRNFNIWAPWRLEYIDSLADGDKECFLCRHRDEPGDDRRNLVLWRGSGCFAMLNRFPYTGGHSMIAPMEHVGDMNDLDDKTALEMFRMTIAVKKVLDEVVRAEGYNIGINIGRCAGAGLPGHLHLHVVPRWNGDTNFLPVLGKVRVIPQALEDLYDAMIEAGGKLNLPDLSVGRQGND